MTAGWRECADPVELAAAVAAGVEVLLSTTASTRWPSTSVTADQFRRNLNSGVRYRVPSSWSPEPPAPVTGDDLRERIARAAACAYMRVPVEAMDPRIIIEPMWPEVADAVLAVLPPQPAPSPVPPWPGAVLSGLCDEDGVPTWLALAGQVPHGVELRRCTDLDWVGNRGVFTDTAWVEVRAPRAVPAPETERVPWWEALRDGRRLAACDEGEWFPCEASGIHDDTGERWVGVSNGGVWTIPAPDGTVEVLKDGDR